MVVSLMRTQNAGTKDVPPSPNLEAGKGIGKAYQYEPGSWLWAWGRIEIEESASREGSDGLTQLGWCTGSLDWRGKEIGYGRLG